MAFQFNGFSESTADAQGRAGTKGRGVLGHGPKVVKSGTLQAHGSCRLGPFQHWLAGSPKSPALASPVSLGSANPAATCHSISGLLELYAQLTAPIGGLKSGKAEI